MQFGSLIFYLGLHRALTKYQPYHELLNVSV